LVVVLGSPGVTKICLNTDIVENGHRFRQGLIGRIVLPLGYKAWLVEFKYPDFHYPCKTKRVYAEVGTGQFVEVDEAPSQA